MEPPGPVGAQSRSALLRTGSAVGLGASAAVVGLLFLFPFLSGRSTTPFGFDTPNYLWHSNLVIAEGLDGLAAIDPIINANPHHDRPVYPVFATLASHVARVDPSTLAYVVPAVFAVTIGLAGASFALEVLREPAWSLPVYAVLLGGSLLVIRTAVGSIDNLMVDAVLLAAATATLLFATNRRGGVAAVALLVAAALIHWIFVALFVLLLLGVAGLLLPSSLRAARAGARLVSTPSPRILAVAVGSVVGTVTSFLLTPGFGLTTPTLHVDEIEAKMAARLPSLRLPIQGLIAAGGGLALWWPRSAVRRSGLALLGLWALSLPLSLLAYELRHHHLAAYRVAEFALAIPLLAAAALVGITRIGARRFGILGAVVGGAVVALGLTASIVVGSRQWDGESGILLPDRVRQVATSASYLRAVGARGPVVFVVSTPTLHPPDRVIRAGMPGSLVASVRLFAGRGEDLLAGHPTTVPGGGAIQTSSAASWPAVRDLLDRGYIAIYLPAFNPLFGPPSGAAQVAPDVWVLRGPAPPKPIRAAAVGAPEPWRLISATALMLVFLGVAGLGWTVSLLDMEWMARVALAPAAGAGALAFATLPLARIGGPVGAAGAWFVYLTIAAGGWVLLAAQRLLRGRGSATSPRTRSPARPE